MTEQEQLDAMAEHLAECEAVFEEVRQPALAEAPIANITPLEKARRRAAVVNSVAVALEAKLAHLDEAPVGIDAKIFGPHRAGLVAQIRSHREYQDKVAADLAALEGEPARDPNRGKSIARANALAGIRKVASALGVEIDRHEAAEPSERETRRHEAEIATLSAKLDACFAAYFNVA